MLSIVQTASYLILPTVFPSGPQSYLHLRPQLRKVQQTAQGHRLQLETRAVWLQSPHRRSPTTRENSCHQLTCHVSHIGTTRKGQLLTLNYHSFKYLWVMSTGMRKRLRGSRVTEFCSETPICGRKQQTEKHRPLRVWKPGGPKYQPDSAKPQSETTKFDNVLSITQNKQTRGEQKGNTDNTASPSELVGGCGEKSNLHSWHPGFKWDPVPLKL